MKLYSFIFCCCTFLGIFTTCSTGNTDSHQIVGEWKSVETGSVIEFFDDQTFIGTDGSRRPWRLIDNQTVEIGGFRSTISFSGQYLTIRSELDLKSVRYIRTR